MSRKARILIVEHANVIQAMNAAAEAMAARGHEVVRYAKRQDMLADRASLAEADVLLISSNFPCTREILATPPRLRAALFAASGIETIDIAAATDLGIVVGNGATPENYEGMAEATILVMLALLYDLRQSEAILRDNRPRPPRVYAHMMKGKTIGLIGMGKIARAVVARLQNWDVEFLTFVRRDPGAPLPTGVRRVGLEELMRQSDIVSIHTSLNDESRGMIDERKLRLMKPTAYILNTARGGIIDEAALYRVSAEQRIAGIGLDVFAVEPLPPDSKLREIPGAILTQHIVGHTVEGNNSLDRTAIENIDRVLRGEPPLYVCNPAVLPQWRERWGSKSGA